jgi:KDO2-lipid IV(A) lauroyltransferase
VPDLARGPDIERFWRRWIVHPLEAAAVYALYGLLRLLPLDRASALGGRVARLIGPHLPVSRHARRNLELAFPEKAAPEIRAIVAAMWENLGRTVAEYPHLDRIEIGTRDGHVQVSGADVIDLMKEDGRPGIFFAAHLGNWEIASMVGTWRGLPLARVYRPANNRFIERLIRHGRREISGTLVPKGAGGAREILATLKAGGHVAIMVDQKMNDGIAVPFFGRAAMTAPALAQFALRFDCPVVPVRVERLAGARFKFTAYPPLVLPRTGDRMADLRAGMIRVNQVIEGWIRERPEQWLWLHRRWPES